MHIACFLFLVRFKLGLPFSYSCGMHPASFLLSLFCFILILPSLLFALSFFSSFFLTSSLLYFLTLSQSSLLSSPLHLISPSLLHKIDIIDRSATFFDPPIRPPLALAPSVCSAHCQFQIHCYPRRLGWHCIPFRGRSRKLAPGFSIC